MSLAAFGTTSRIYVAADGEMPQPGHFFAVDSNWTLSKIAKRAYNDSSAWKILNMNQWNIDNLVYRADSTSCSSAKRDPIWAKTTTSPTTGAKTAYISLCQRDANQPDSWPLRTFKFPVIWIPDPSSRPMPESVDASGDDERTDIERADVTININPKPKAPTTPSSPETPGEPTPEQKKDKLAGFGLIAGGIALLAVVLILPGNR